MKSLVITLFIGIVRELGVRGLLLYRRTEAVQVPHWIRAAVLCVVSLGLIGMASADARLAPALPIAEVDDELPADITTTGDEAQQLMLLAELIRIRADDQAMNLAQSMLLEWEGEPEFDILFARAAMNVGSYQRAAFALERALMVYPREMNLRLMLIESYLGLGNTSAARRQLELTDDREKTAPQQSRWNSLQRQMERQQMARQSQDTVTIGAEVHYFSNINSGVGFDELTVDVDGVPFDVDLDDSAQAQQALATTLQGSYERVRPLTQRRQSRTTVGLTTRLSPYSDANNLGGLLSYGRESTAGRSVTAQLIPAWNQDGWRVTAAVAGEQEDLWQTVDFGVRLSWTSGDTQSGQLQGTISDQFSLSAVLVPWQVNTGFTLSENDAQNHLSLGGSVQPTWQPAGAWLYQGGVGLQHQWYLNAGDDNERLQNLFLQLDAQALRPLVGSGLLTLRTTYRNNFSTEPLNRYQGYEFAVGYQYAW